MSARVLVSTPTARESFRERLQRELAQRCARNPRYSLRGFANFLGVDHATLSQLLRGKRAVTPASIRWLAQLFIEVDDCAACVARAAKLGATTLIPPQVLPDGDVMAILKDPAGMSFGVFQPGA